MKTLTRLAAASALLFAPDRAACGCHDCCGGDCCFPGRRRASSVYFSKSYAYAVFPSVGSGAIGLGGAYGKGRVYVHGKHVGDTKMGQLGIGFQAVAAKPIAKSSFSRTSARWMNSSRATSSSAPTPASWP